MLFVYSLTPRLKAYITSGNKSIFSDYDTIHSAKTIPIISSDSGRSRTWTKMVYIQLSQHSCEYHGELNLDLMIWLLELAPL